MSISPGYTEDEIREMVYHYECLPHGAKLEWVKAQPFSLGELRRWRRSVHEGDLSRGLIPRDDISPSTSIKERRRMAHEHSLRNTEKRVCELEDENKRLREANDALGKAIGLLHNYSAQRPDGSPEATSPDGSSTTKTNSSES
ncbi:hypothetical protein [Brachybacterium sp. GCM10030252]|uniref:hypothetical protein n=1 Tax=Brachybacterium sp. GCM10030252 TaxID=3273380 RepID=UPI00361DBC75